MKAVLFTAAARRNLRKLPAEVREQLEAKLQRYAQTGAGDVQTLQGAAGARLRSGDYRMIFIETDHAVEVQALGHRRDIYR